MRQDTWAPAAWSSSRASIVTLEVRQGTCRRSGTRLGDLVASEGPSEPLQGVTAGMSPKDREPPQVRSVEASVLHLQGSVALSKPKEESIMALQVVSVWPRPSVVRSWAPRPLKSCLASATRLSNPCLVAQDGIKRFLKVQISSLTLSPSTVSLTQLQTV